MCSLQVEAGEMPLSLRRKQLLVNYWISLRGQIDSHPTKIVLQDNWEKGKGKEIVLVGQEMMLHVTWEYMERSFVKL